MFINNNNKDSFIFKPEESNIINKNDEMIFDLYDFILMKDSDDMNKYEINNDNFYLIINLKLPGYIVKMIFKIMGN